MFETNESKSKEPLSFQRGVERRETKKLAQINLKRKVNDIIAYRDIVSAQLGKVYDSAGRELLRKQLLALADHALKGADLIGTDKLEEIQAFLATDYRNIKE